MNLETQWSNIKKAGVVFLTTYLLFLLLPLLLPLDALTLWFGKSILQIKDLEKIEMTGSGDTTFDYVNLLLVIVLACIAFVVAFCIKIKQSLAENMYKYAEVYMRYLLGLMLISYGMAKLTEGGQFPEPGFGRLNQNYGESSPMGLVWTFMGSSRAYTIFTGFCEIIPGFLLLFRKTKLIGALMAIAVMLNIVLLNFCYDIPVKLFSATLLLLAIIIAFPNIKNLVRFLTGDASAKLKKSSEIILPKQWMRVFRLVLKVIIVVGIPAISLVQVFMYPLGEETAITGLYTNLHKTDNTFKWNSLTINEKFKRAAIKTDEKKEMYAVKVSDKNTLILTSYADSTKVLTLHLSNVDKDVVTIKTDSLSGEFTKKVKSDYLLLNRGFHWVNEYPFNK